jgi:SAM-dependent methyltransferase
MHQSQLYAVYDCDPEPIVGFLAYVRDLYGLPRPGTVLDMGCGSGRLLASLVQGGT